MSVPVKYTIEWSIQPGKTAAFKELAGEATKMARKNEPKMLGYQWYYTQDGSKAYLSARQTDSVAILDHLSNMAEMTGRLLKISSITRLEVFGEIAPQVQEALAPFGAKVFSYQEGFTR